jgi:SAM-dependent methyltransferase
MIAKKDIDGGRPFDWGRASGDYAKYRDIYPEAFYQKIIDLGLCAKGQRVLDLGTGTGVLPRNLYRHGASFTGADISENQISQARRLSADAGMDIEYVAVSAEGASFPSRSFDVVTACQCIIYFDKAAAMPNIHRMLKDGGRFCILFMAWLTDESDIASQSEKLVLKYNPAWTGCCLNRRAAGSPLCAMPEFSEGLFEIEHAEAFDLTVKFTRESWHGRIKACRGIGASSLAAEEIAAFEKEHVDFLGGQPESFNILHYATIQVLRKI